MSTVSIEQPARDAGLTAPRSYEVNSARAEAAVGTRRLADYKEYVHWFGPGPSTRDWGTSGDDPDRWTVGGRPGRGSGLAYFDGGFVEFLHTFVRDTVELPFIPEAEVRPAHPVRAGYGE